MNEILCSGNPAFALTQSNMPERKCCVCHALMYINWYGAVRLGGSADVQTHSRADMHVLRRSQEELAAHWSESQAAARVEFT